jgi:hypothetical protein
MTKDSPRVSRVTGGCLRRAQKHSVRMAMGGAAAADGAHVSSGPETEDAGAAAPCTGAPAPAGDDREAAELREIAALQKEIAEQEALLDEHQSKLVSVALGSADGGGSARSVRARDHDARRVVGMTRMRVGMPRACAERK